MSNGKENTNKETDTEIKYNWQLFAESFLNITVIGCKKILNYNNFAGKTDGFWNRNLIIATIYNFKHLLEIILKTLIKDFYPEKLKTTHDVEDIFNDIHPIIFNNIISRYKKLEKKIKEEPVEKLFEAVSFSENTLESNFLKLEEIVNYYINISFIKKEIISVKDIDNSLFKYPEQKDKKISLDYLYFMKEENFEEVKKIIRKVSKDCDELRIIVRQILAINSWIKSVEDYLENKNAK